MLKSKWIRILTSLGVVLLIVFIVVPPFTRKWYGIHSLKLAPPVPANSWKKFSSPEGRFSVWFPGTPEETTKPLHNLIGEIEAHSFAVKADIQDFYA